MKEKLGNALGVVGIILWYLFSFVFCFAPLLFLDLPFWVKALAVFAILSFPLLGELVRFVLYICAFFVVISEPIDAFSILFFVCCAIYVFVFGVPLLQSIIEFLKGSRQD